MVQMVTNGVRLGEFRPDDADDEVEIRLRYPEQNRQLAALDELRVNTPAGPVPISSFQSACCQAASGCHSAYRYA